MEVINSLLILAQIVVQGPPAMPMPVVHPFGSIQPTCYWSLDEASGGRTDTEPNGTPRNLNDVNATGSRTGVINNGADFVSASSQKLTVADNTDTTGGDVDFSISFVVNLDAEVGDRFFFGQWVAAGFQQAFYGGYDLSDDRMRFAVSNDGSAEVAVTANTFGATTTGQNYFIVCGHDATNNQIWISVNGSNKDVVAHSTGVFNSTADFVIGSRASAGYTDGLIDEFIFWRGTTLTDEQIDWMYNSGTYRKPPMLP